MKALRITWKILKLIVQALRILSIGAVYVAVGIGFVVMFVLRCVSLIIHGIMHILRFLYRSGKATTHNTVSTQ